MIRRRFNPLAGLALLATLAACGQSDEGGNQVAPPEASQEAAPATQHAVQTLPIEEQRSLAFRAAFAENPVLDVEDGQLRYTPARLEWIGDRAVLLSLGKNLDECHACTGALAVHYLEPAGDGFRVTGAWPTLIRGSGYGAPPSEWNLSDKFAQYPVVLVEGGYTAQGCTSGGITLTELRPDEPVQSTLIRTIYSNQSGFGADNGAEIEGEIANIDKGASFDVVYSGSRDFTETWIRRGDSFELRGGETRMPIC